MSRSKLLILGKNEGILMRPDGTRVKGLTPIVQALPHIMPKRYDAQNWASDYVDEDILKTYIRQKRREGRLVTHMSVIVAAYYKAALENPKVNYFIMNRKVYKRNHFCFSFVILKTRADGTPDETTLKVFLQPEDTIFTISAVDAILAISAVDAILAVGALRLDLIAILIEQPLTVERPVVYAIGILLNTNNRGVTTILAILAVSAILAICAVIDGDRVGLGKGDSIANSLAILGYGGYRRNIVVGLQSCDYSLQRIDIGVHLATHLLEARDATLVVVEFIPNGLVVKCTTRR